MTCIGHCSDIEAIVISENTIINSTELRGGLPSSCLMLSRSAGLSLVSTPSHQGHYGSPLDVQNPSVTVDWTGERIQSCMQSLWARLDIAYCVGKLCVSPRKFHKF